MIAGISLGKSFAHCIGYCLDDKRTLSEEQKINKSLLDGLLHKGRAEVLAYNKCFGDKHELAEQFNDVRRLSKKVEKPVLHVSLRLAPGERLSQQQWIDIGQEIAKELGVAENQYLIVQHRDTPEQHIHLVANRVGYDGKAASTSNNFFKMDRLCRRLEKEYQLHEVLSPRQFLPKELRHLPRHDSRKEKMKADIGQSLKRSAHYQEFAVKMQALGYQIIRGRGITFIDDKKVKVKGSDLDFSLATIEKILNQKLRQPSKPQNLPPAEPEKRDSGSPNQKKDGGRTPAQRTATQTVVDKMPGQSWTDPLEKGAASLLHDLMKPEHVDGDNNAQLMKEVYKKKKKRKRPRL